MDNKKRPLAGWLCKKLRKLIHKHCHYNEVKEYIELLPMHLNKKPFDSNPESNLIVSLASFPARIRDAWIPIETMLQQDFPPWKIILVLAEEEFPGLRLPKKLRQQEERGLEILWTDRNIRSYKKLLPVRKTYPDATIVTIDDDVIYEPWRLSQLFTASRQRPGAIIGHRGWEVTSSDNRLIPYTQWPAAHLKTASRQVFLTGMGGVLYPPHVLPEDLLMDIDLAERLCPTSDDIWFWAMSLISETDVVCLGNHNAREIRRQRLTPALYKINVLDGANDIQLKQILDYFDLWKKLV